MRGCFDSCFGNSIRKGAKALSVKDDIYFFFLFYVRWMRHCFFFRPFFPISSDRTMGKGMGGHQCICEYYKAVQVVGLLPKSKAFDTLTKGL